MAEAVIELGSQTIHLMFVDNKIAKALVSAQGEWQVSESAGNAGNDQATNNSTGFSALPGGSRHNWSRFEGSGQYGIWWSTTEDGDSRAGCRVLHYDHEHLFNINLYKTVGLSVRLVQDVD